MALHSSRWLCLLLLPTLAVVALVLVCATCGHGHDAAALAVVERNPLMLSIRHPPSLQPAVRMCRPWLPRGPVNLPRRCAWVVVIALALVCGTLVPTVSGVSGHRHAPDRFAALTLTACHDPTREVPTVPSGGWAVGPRESLATDKADDLDVDDDDDHAFLTSLTGEGVPLQPPPARAEDRGPTTTVPRPSRFLLRPTLLTRAHPLPVGRDIA
jgi:hypothetical protein